jgi:hypothetical protein
VPPLDLRYRVEHPELLVDVVPDGRSGPAASRMMMMWTLLQGTRMLRGGVRVIVGGAIGRDGIVIVIIPRRNRRREAHRLQNVAPALQ